MQFGLASPIICLYEKSSAFAVGNNTSETRLDYDFGVSIFCLGGKYSEL